MKKKIIILLSIIAIALGLTCGYFCIRRAIVLREFLDEYKIAEDKVYIYNNSVITFYSDEELNNLTEFYGNEIDKELTKKQQDFTINALNTLIDKLYKVKFKAVKKIDNEQSVTYGFINIKKNKNIKESKVNSYMSIYENGTVLLNKNNKYYVYVIKDFDELNSFYKELVKDFDGYPLFNIN